jgi:hypothetical protein
MLWTCDLSTQTILSATVFRLRHPRGAAVLCQLYARIIDFPK